LPSEVDPPNAVPDGGPTAPLAAAAAYLSSAWYGGQSVPLGDAVARWALLLLPDNVSAGAAWVVDDQGWTPVPGLCPTMRFELVNVREALWAFWYDDVGVVRWARVERG
jgi:hypothetical protein